MKHTFLRKCIAGISLSALLWGPLASFSGEMTEVKAAELPNPVLKVTFDDGTAADVTGRQNDGEVVGSPEFIKGVKGQAIHLQNPSEIAGEYENAEQYVNFGSAEDLKFGTDDFSIAFWYKADGTDTSEVAVVGNKDWNSGGNEGLVIGDMRNGMTLNFTAQGAGRIDTSRVTEATDNTWHYITATFDRDGAMTLYVDGTQMTSKDISAQAGKSIDVADFVLGADGYKRFGVEDSYIDEFEVYKEVLTSEQIGQLMIVEENETEKPVLNVTFDDETANDTSGNDNHGTITGAVEFVDGVEGKAVHIVNPAEIAGEYAQAQQYINFGQPEELKFAAESFSILFWYKADGADTSEVAVVGNKDWNSGGNPGLVIGDMRNGMTLNFTAQGEGRIDTSRIAKATDNTWHHVAAVFNRTGDMVLYIDGEEAARKSINSAEGKSIDVADFVLGADGYKRFGVEDSYIDEFQVYKTALTQEELSDIIAPYVLKNKITEYENAIAQSDASTEKKDKFAAAVAKVKEASEGVKDPDEVNAFMEELRKAYNEFCGPEEGLAEFVVFSDTHVASNLTDASAVNLIDALEDVKEYFPNVKAVVNSGDFSSNGYENEYKAYFDILGQFDSDFVFMNALGNHDVRWKSGWDEIYERYMRYNGKYMDKTDGPVYYDRWIDGYHFIVLNTEWDLKDRAYISDTQLEWLDETMAEGAEDGKPIFIMFHQALRDTYWNSNDWDDGVQDFALKEVLRKYPQTVMFTGHIHNGLGKLAVVETDYGTMVDVPGFLSNDYGDGRGQIGYHVTIYDDSVQLSMRDYKADEWLPEYNYTIDLNPAKKPAGKVLDVNFDDETANDVSGHGNDGTIVGDVEFTEGVNGKAIHIVNSDDKETADQYVEFGLADDLRFGEDDFSILFWYKAEEEQSVEGSILANKDWDSGANQGFAIGNFSGSRPGVGLNYTAEGSQRKDTSRYTAATDGNWHHVAATFDRDGSMVLYIDGKAVESKDISEDAGKTIDVDTLQLILGADANGKYPVHDSYIDELKIYRKVLKAAELETVCTPFEVTAEKTKVSVSWDMSEYIDEPAYIIMGEERYEIASADTSKVITGLESGKEYSMMLVTREKANKGNLKNAYTLNFKTEEAGEDPSPTVDKTALIAIVEEYEDFDTSAYTETSAQAFEQAYEAAAALVDAETTQEEVDEAVAALQEAYDALEEKTPSGSVGYGADDIAGITITNAELPEDDGTNVQSMIHQGTYDGLFDGNKGRDFEFLWDIESNYVDGALPSYVTLPVTLTITMNEGTNLNEVSVYNANKANGYVTKAQAVLNYSDGTKSEPQTVELTDLVDNSVFAFAWDNGDKTAVSVEITLLEAMKANGDAVTNMLTLAEIELKGTNAQTPPTPVEPADKTELAAVIAEAEGLNADDYTEESFAALTEALDAAKAVNDKEDATQTEVDAAKEALQAAIDALVEKEPVTPGKEVCQIFTDVAHASWYEEAVQYVYDKGLMEGNGNLFTPNGQMTRGMFVTTLYRLAGKPALTEDDRAALTELHDVAENAWYTDAVCWAYANGITTGYESDRTFRTNVALSREQLATFLYRYADYQGLDISDSNDLTGLVNADKVKPYAEKEVKWAVGAGIINGMEITDEAGETVYDLAPQKTATRAQMAQILKNFCEAYDL